MDASDRLTAMMLWEQGRLPDDQMATLFQELVDTGEAWRLQGAYGRVANALIQNGVIRAPERATGSDVLTVTLTVKAGNGAREDTARRLNEWANATRTRDPFPPGALLHYSIKPYAARWGQ